MPTLILIGELDDWTPAHECRPAVVLLHGCGGGWRGLDERWGKRLAEWGYVTLTVDRFGTRGIKHTCTSGLPPSTTCTTPIAR